MPMADRSFRPGLLLLLGLAGLARPAPAQPLHLRLPTSNDALYTGDGPAFYQYTDRNFEGEASRPWEAGRYGFVRNLVRTPAGVVYTRFHEGLDIRPIFRDEDGEPLDTVRSVDDGRVVYFSANPNASNYGRYVVVEHWWQGAAYYALYAHLAEVEAQPGMFIRRGTPVGRLGYSGDGLDQRRAHVHFEINLLLADRFERWHAANFPRVRNEHGRWNGQNLAGVDPSALYLALRRDPNLDLGAHLRDQDEGFAVAVPGGQLPDLARRYPWMLDATPERLPPGWEVRFTASGMPYRFTPLRYTVGAPVLLRVSAAVREGHLATNGYLARRSDAYALTTRGLRYLDLVTTPAVGLSGP